VEVIRRGKSKKLSVVTGRLDEPDLAKATQNNDAPKKNGNGEYMHSGLTLQNINPQSRRDFELGDKASGALVVDVDRSSAAFEAGIRAGDVIAEIDQQAVGSAKTAVEALQRAKKNGRKSVLIFVRSRGTVRFIALPLSN